MNHIKAMLVLIVIAEAALLASGHAVARIGGARAGSGVRLCGGAPLQRFDRDELSRVL